jgi:hypothetical protein
MAAHGRFTESAAKQRLVKEVQFGVLSPDEIVGIIVRSTTMSCALCDRSDIVDNCFPHHSGACQF